MGVVSAIVALCRALPILERIFLNVADSIKQAKAKARYDSKLAFIDTAIANARPGVPHSRVQGFEWCEEPDRTPRISEGGTISADVDQGGTKKGGRVRIRT